MIPMHIAQRHELDVTYLEVVGELDLLDAIELGEAGRQALTPDCRVLRIDLSGVTFIGSSGLAALIAIRNEALAAHELILDNVPSSFRRVLELSGLSSVFKIQ